MINEDVKNMISRVDRGIEDVAALVSDASPLVNSIVLNPEIASPLLSLIGTVTQYIRNIKNAHRDGKKIAMMNFNLPPSILYAMDVVPICPEVLSTVYSIFWPRGQWNFIDACIDIGLPDSLCTAQRGGIGSILTNFPLVERPDFVINAASGSCDTNSAIFEFTAEHYNIPCFNLDVPPYYDENGEMAEIYRANYRDMISFIEKQTGKALNEEKLRKVCEEVRKTRDYTLELYEMRKASPNPVANIFDLCEFGTRILAGGTEFCTSTFEKCYEASKYRLKEKKGVFPDEKVRTIYIYLPHFGPATKGWSWLEINGISLLINLLSLFNHQFYKIDKSNIDTMIDSLADESSNYMMTKQIRGPYDFYGQWYDGCKTVINDLNPDCAIYIGTMGCKNTQGAVRPLAKDLEEDFGIPALILTMDAWDERVFSWDNIKNKINEFIELRIL